MHEVQPSTGCAGQGGSAYTATCRTGNEAGVGSTRGLQRKLRSAALLASLLPSLTGCLSLSVRVHPVPKTVVAGNLMDATLPQLVQRLNAQDAAIQGLFATVEITANTGGQHEGEVKEIPTFAGYILLRKPGDLRVFLLLPVIRSRALDMVTDGINFKLLIPPKNRAITGTDKEVEMPAEGHTPGSATAANGLQNRNSGLETLRPYIVRDALVIPALKPEELISPTESARILPPTRGRKEALEVPDYDLTVLRHAPDQSSGEPNTHAHGQVLERVRVIHISRDNLQPYQQDIYDHRGRIVTSVQYSKYQRFGDVDYPTSILITRPLDEYSLKIVITKLTVNPKFDDEQFQLKIPDNVPVQKM